MKTLYKVVIFIAVFQTAIIAVNALGGSGIFPYQLYDDLDVVDLVDNSSTPLDMVGHIFLPEGTPAP